MDDKNTDYNKKIADKLVHLSRLALSGRRQDILLYIRRLASTLRDHPEAAALSSMLREMPSQSSPLRGDLSAIPVDRDSRLQLVRSEYPVILPAEPVWQLEIKSALEQVVLERRNDENLLREGLAPTRSVIFTGMPGVGKSLAARWLAREMKRPLLTLDLSAVMSSFLGRTGANVRYVLDYAKETPCVLLLDEFDAIAKRRDDSVEVGELKRLVTVLLQEIDDWPSTGLLIAATNHPMLLDPAVWRRFEMNISFPMPDRSSIAKLIGLRMPEEIKKTDWPSVFVALMSGKSFSDIERTLNSARRESIVNKWPLEQSFERIARDHVKDLKVADRISVAKGLVGCGLSQRRVHELTGVSRDTLRKRQGMAA